MRFLESNSSMQISSQAFPTRYITDGGFLKEKGDFNVESVYPLGFTQAMLDEWKLKQSYLLEIGPGKGKSFLWLYNNGFNIYAIEPGLRNPYDDHAKEARRLLLPYQQLGRISAVNASDAPYAFPDIHFDVAFALRGNFHLYAPSSGALFAQISGILAALKPEQHSFLAFQSWTANGDVEYGRSQQIALGTMLRNIGIKADSPDIGEPMLRIFRLNDYGDDALSVFSSLFSIPEEDYPPINY